jgi:hypothetical protein
MTTGNDLSLPPNLAGPILQTAKAKRILGGNAASIIARLDGMAQDLHPGGGSCFPALIAALDGARKNPPPGIREIGDLFSASRDISLENRRLEGCFYTPEAIIDHILDLIWKDLFPSGFPDAEEGKTLCDTALGCGFFFLRLAERLRAEFPSRLRDVRRWAARCLFGVDIDAEALFMAKILLWLALSGPDEEFIVAPGHFRRGDSLLGPSFGDSFVDGSPSGPDGYPIIDWPKSYPEIAASGGFDAIVGNPPFEVLTNFRQRPARAWLAGALRQTGRYRYSLHGQINLYRCFIERNLSLLRPGGVLGLLTPLSLARDASALPLRRRLLENESAGDWLLFSENDRIFTGVTQSICIFRAVRLGGGVEKLRTGRNEMEGVWNMEEAGDWGCGESIIPFPGDNTPKLLSWLHRHCPNRLGDAAEMLVGEVDLTLYRDCLSDENNGCLLARGSHLSPFRLNPPPASGRTKFLDRDKFLKMKGKAAAVCQERLAKTRVVQLGIRNMLSRPRLIAALAPPGLYAANSLNFFLPKGDLPIECLAGLLNSRLLDRLFRFSSGNNNINLAEMRRLPFPADPDADLAQSVALAYRLCARAAENDPDGLADARKRLDDSVEDFYRLPPELREELEREERPAVIPAGLTAIRPRRIRSIPSPDGRRRNRGGRTSRVENFGRPIP